MEYRDLIIDDKNKESKRKDDEIYFRGTWRPIQGGFGGPYSGIFPVRRPIKDEPDDRLEKLEEKVELIKQRLDHMFLRVEKLFKSKS